MTGFKFHFGDYVIILSAVLAVIVGGFAAFAKQADTAPDNCLRMHILANSDSKEDQALKYELRDYILARFGGVFAACDSKQQAVETAKEYKADMQAAAERFVAERGYNYPVKCEVSTEHFTTRNYEAYTLPSGDYAAVRFLIGSAEGRNWWCVMFPPLCLPAATEGYTPEQSRNIEESPHIEIKFKVFEWFQDILNFFGI